MNYISTRGGLPPQSFCASLIGGLAPDGGLVMPQHYPTITPTTLAEWRTLSYPELAHAILQLFISDIPQDDLRDLIHKTYTIEKFGDPAITPVIPLLDDVYLLRLSNGPTLAFKDIALQLLGNLFEYVLEKNKCDLNILGATSGDTGSSAEYAMLGKKNVRIFMLSPYQKMSAFQTAQMFSLNEPNIFNIAIRGVFDDCQDIVKAVSNDAEFKQRYRIGAVNSINWARVAAQIVYYFKGYFATTTDNNQWIDVAVPSGNFGNILAGHIARQMGLPIRQLILATNENNVLDEFFKTGHYRVRKSADVIPTSSPSMDISKASNFERFIFDVVGRNADKVRELWQDVEKYGGFDLSKTADWLTLERFGFVSGSSTHTDRLQTIRYVYQRTGYTIDTHTADGIKVGLEKHRPGIPLLCLETALAVKFEETIIQALGRSPVRPSGYEQIEQRPQHFVVMDRDPQAIKAYIAQHSSD